MHTWTCGETTIHYNSDMGGAVRIEVDGQPFIEVPASHLLMFIGEYVRRERIRCLEQASLESILHGTARVPKP